jgi:DNA-binding transcriptional LysR family regulator
VHVIGAVARTIDEWRELVVAGRGISLCPASAEQFHARPGLAFVPACGVAAAELCVAWRAGHSSPVVQRFAQVAATAAGQARELSHTPSTASPAIPGVASAAGHSSGPS